MPGFNTSEKTQYTNHLHAKPSNDGESSTILVKGLPPARPWDHILGMKYGDNIKCQRDLDEDNDIEDAFVTHKKINNGKGGIEVQFVSKEEAKDFFDDWNGQMWKYFTISIEYVKDIETTHQVALGDYMKDDV